MLIQNIQRPVNNIEFKSHGNMSDKSINSERKDISKISQIDKTFNNEMRSMNSTQNDFNIKLNDNFAEQIGNIKNHIGNIFNKLGDLDRVMVEFQEIDEERNGQIKLFR